MKTTIDIAGRLVIPKEIRQKAGIEPGMVLNVRWREGRIEIEPTLTPVTLIQKGHLWVAVPGESLPPLSTDLVEETRDALAREREQ
jgi:AbrB family looped-hinge helix DNA binding protein